jgi:hypothetical protein
MSFSRAILGIAFALFSLLATACSDSDQYLFDSRDSQEIKVYAYTTTSFDPDAQTTKSDTIQPSDSLIFLTTVQPSKSIRNTSYFWTIDGEPFASEFSFKRNITNPGIHDIAFVFIDFFGDTLSDTLSITVASPPELDNEHFIPAAGTQNIDPDKALHFAWNGHDPDSMWQMFYHFTLKDETESTLVDTILNQAYFSYFSGFNPLHKYTWKVSAFNEMLLEAGQNITAHFFTNGRNGEGAISGTIHTNSEEKDYRYKVSLMDSSFSLIQETKVPDSSRPTFRIAPLPKGTYKLVTVAEDLNEFTPDTIEIRLRGGQVAELDSILLMDFTAPTIESITAKDTIDFADTLRFLLRDLGGGTSIAKTSVIYDDELIHDLSLQGDTLLVPFAERAGVKIWTFKFITITTADFCNNRTKKIFYLRPNSTLTEVFSD